MPGVKQGDVLLSTLFILFINDFTAGIKSTGIGVPLEVLYLVYCFMQTMLCYLLNQKNTCKPWSILPMTGVSNRE